jgi:hypothetical protein
MASRSRKIGLHRFNIRKMRSAAGLSITSWRQRLRDARLAFVFVDPDRAVALRLLLRADFLFGDFARFTRSGRFARPVSRFHSS